MPAVGKIAIVCSGGGMRCSYGAGALYALATVHSLIKPDIIVAASGSVGSSIYFIAGQYGIAREMWTECLTTPRFISIARFWRVMDVDYLIDDVFKRQLPLNAEAVAASTTRYFFAVTNKRTNAVRFVSNADGVDYFELMRAAKSAPFVSRGQVNIGEAVYTDAAFTVTFESLIDKARKEGADKIIAIDNRSDWKRKSLSVASDVILVTDDHIPTGLLTIDAGRLTASFDLGYRAVAENKQLAGIVSQSRSNSVH